MPEREPFRIAGQEVRAGTRSAIRIPVARRYTHSEIFLPAEVLHGRKPGPRLFVSAAVHGDEINGVEIIRRLLALRLLRRLSGTLIAVPIVNVYGFLAGTRNLPDRRDLNRSFPGSETGSLTARLAHRFVSEVVARATHGIDLHTGTIHRTNLPQIRACLDDPETMRLARAFGVPVILNANVRDGSLREAVLERGMPMLLYEGGEALRFDETSIRAGVRGVLSVMRALRMIPPTGHHTGPLVEPFLARSSTWIRAPQSGILRAAVRLGARVTQGQELGVIADPLGDREAPVKSHASGIVIGQTRLPLADEGDALFHVATFDEPRSAAEQVAAFRAALDEEEPLPL